MFRPYEPTKNPPARILAVGVGGAGCWVIDHMIKSGVPGIEFITADVDAQLLGCCLSPRKLVLGERTKPTPFHRIPPEWARKAVLDDEAMIRGALEGADLVFVVAGLGGGFGTGATPVLVEVAKDMGALSIAVLSTPFSFEGKRRVAQAERGRNEIERLADMTVLIRYDRLRLLIAPQTKFPEVFALAPEVMGCGVRGLTELIRSGEGAILDGGFEQARRHLVDCGLTYMGFGSGESLMQTMEAALSCPLLEEGVRERARKLILCVGAADETTLEELQDAVELLQPRLRDDVDVVWGVVGVQGEPRVTLYVTDLTGPEES